MSKEYSQSIVVSLPRIYEAALKAKRDPPNKVTGEGIYTAFMQVSLKSGESFFVKDFSSSFLYFYTLVSGEI